MARRLGVLYEHPEWFRPLFAALDGRGLPYVPIAAHEHSFDPAARTVPFDLLVNRVSPSSYLRGHTSAIFYARAYLAYTEMLGVPIINGSQAYAYELSKAAQLSLLASLGLPHPRSRVVNLVSELTNAAAALEYPVIVKPNIGGSGALMQRFDAPADLRAAVHAGTLDPILGLDHTMVVQEYHPPRDSAIVRVEALDDQFLYAIRIRNAAAGSAFNLCPADICQAPEAVSTAEAQESSADTSFETCPVEAPTQSGLQVTATQPAPGAVDAVLRIFRAAHIDIGGVEYLESQRDGRLYFYDINTLSNFVTDAPNVVGFDPFERFVDVLERRLTATARDPQPDRTRTNGAAVAHSASR